MGQNTARAAVGGARTREAILEAAERVFAARGFDGASVREIARAAGINQPLIHYHFDSKDRLYAEVFNRRASAINATRAKALDALEAAHAPHSPPIETVLEALLRPALELGRDTHRAGGDHFARLVVAVAAGTDPRSTQLIATHYDAIARRFIGAFRRALPGLSPTDAVWGYLYAIGIALPLMARTGRATTLSDGVADENDVEGILSRTIPFIAAGLRALVGHEAAPMAPSKGAQR